jgi:hypothetical protein
MPGGLLPSPIHPQHYGEGVALCGPFLLSGPGVSGPGVSGRGVSGLMVAGMGVGPGIGLWGPGTGLWMVSSPGRYNTARTAKIALTCLKSALGSIVAQMQHPERK